jgi:hypothetical protein
MIYLRNPIAKAVYGTLMGGMGLLALDSKPGVGLLLLAVSGLVFWNAAQQWKAASGRNSQHNNVG